LKNDPTWKARFLAAYRKTRCVSLAAQAAGVGVSTCHLHRNEDPEFDAAWSEIWDGFVAELKSSALVRATRGTDSVLVQGGRVIHHKGKPVVEKKFETQLTMLHLKAYGGPEFNDVQKDDTRGQAERLIEAIRAARATVPVPNPA
jgi:hypothetical protein